LVTTNIDNVPTVGAVNLQSGAWHAIARGTQPTYVAPGYVVYHAEHVREGELHAVAFDAGQLAIRGKSFSVQDGVFRGRAGSSAYYALAEAGTFVFAPGGLAHSLVRVDRQGRRTPITAERRGFRFPRISPNGREVAVTIDPRPSQLWIYGLPLSSGGRLLAANGHSISGTWHPGGRHYTYFSKGDVYSRVSDASGAEERLFVRERPQYPAGWTRDGSRLLFVDDHASTYEDIWTFATGGVVAPIIVSPARENNPRLSPDGRWLAHTSDESGRNEIHVRPFPDVHTGKWVVSAGGGHSPVWSESGRELFYMNGNTLMSVAIDAQRAGFVARPPEPLFSGPFDTTQDGNFDVSKDGSFFVMVEADPDQRPTRLQVVLNWSEELRQRGAASATPR
jgi:serine/threonine-protein kinase